MPEYVPNELLSRLVGYELYEVSFLQHLLQLRFQTAPGEAAKDNPLFNFEVWPVVELGDSQVRNSDVGYGDAFRALLGKVVVSTIERTGTGIRIEFDGGAVHAHPASGEVDVEIGMLSGFEDSSWMVWRPGEDSFEDVA